jgi:hypothetical protein
MKKFALHAMLALATAVAFSAHAQEEGAAEAEKPVEVKITGENYSLVATFGEGAQAAPNAATNALKVIEVTGADGAAMPGLEGKTLHYLPLEAAAPLASGDENLGETVVVTGKLYREAAVLVVESFEVEDDLDDWAPLPTGTLSGQQVL